MRSRGELLPLYLATTYWLFLDEREKLALRVGRPHAALDAWLLGHTPPRRCWAFLTACNPGSECLPPRENAARQRLLAQALAEGGWRPLGGEGVGDAGNWPTEPSFFVPGMPCPAALAWAERFGQAALVAGEVGGAARLEWTALAT